MTKRKRKRDRTGRTLENAVARIEQMLDPNSKVTQNERLADRAGNKREYDVVIRGQFVTAAAGHVRPHDHAPVPARKRTTGARPVVVEDSRGRSYTGARCRRTLER